MVTSIATIAVALDPDDDVRMLPDPSRLGDQNLQGLLLPVVLVGVTDTRATTWIGEVVFCPL